MKKFYLFLWILCTWQITAGQNLTLSNLAEWYVSALSPELKATGLLELGHAERFNFNFVPLDRKGPTFHDFSETQKQAALALLKASLSEGGYQKATAIMELEKVLIIIENQPAGGTYRDPLNYHFLIFGTPSSTQAWGWKFEGHHISVNFMMQGDKIVSSTPSFLGANPGVVGIEEQRGKQVLRLETELGFSLINALTAEQLKTARFAEKAVPEIITVNKRKASRLEPQGIMFSALNEQQQKLFKRLVVVYVDNYQLGFAKELNEKITRAGWSNFSFAWAGSLSPGAGHYYRLQGPELLIEYANTQNNANHVHTVVRDLTNDFAEDILRQHYLQEKH